MCVILVLLSQWALIPDLEKLPTDFWRNDKGLLPFYFQNLTPIHQDDHSGVATLHN